MKPKRLFIAMVAGLLSALVALAGPTLARDDLSTIYQVYQPLPMGNEPSRPPKDYYIDMGSSRGLKKGEILQVLRRVSTYDLIHDRIYRQMTVPIALVRLIHVEANTSIARLEKFLPISEAPAQVLQAIMVGDIVIRNNQVRKIPKNQKGMSAVSGTSGPSAVIATVAAKDSE